MTRRSLCAVCDATNATTRLCASCRADPVNAGWSQGASSCDAVVHARPELHDRPAVSPGERARRIIGLVTLYSIRVPLRHEGRRRYVGDGYRWERRPLNLEEIAWLVGCSRQAVRATLERYARKFALAEAAHV